MRHGAGVGAHVGAEVAVGGARGCLRPRLPGTGGGIITGTGKGLTAAGSRTGVASGLAARAAPHSQNRANLSRPVSPGPYTLNSAIACCIAVR